jgi:hypothetical protein
MAAPGTEGLLDALFPAHRHAYSARDVCLYALGVGCGAADLRFVYEGAAEFAPLPTFFAIPAHPAIHAVPLDRFLPKCNPRLGALLLCGGCALSEGVFWFAVAVVFLKPPGHCNTSAPLKMYSLLWVQRPPQPHPPCPPNHATKQPGPPR